ncbi:MAG: ABC transporter permease [Lachnospiraceae bacterium]|nr:ABC transporter permease [Lachnospiraceae bacterium]
MLNYIKSELYRISHSKGIYIFDGVCAGLLLIMNLLLYAIWKDTPSFMYATTAFAFNFASIFIGVVFILTIVMGCIAFGDEYKNRTIGNSIAFGSSSVKIYLGKAIVSLIISFLSLAVVLAIFIGSSYLLLQNSGPDVLWEFLQNYLVNSLILVTGVLATLTLCFLFGSGSAATWGWLILFRGLPIVCQLLGLKFSFFIRLNKWMAAEIIGAQVSGNVDDLNIHWLWQTQDGLYRTLMSGALGILVFLAIGIVGMRRKEM